MLRTPKISDAKTALAFINALVEEDAQILVNKKVTLKEEKKWLEGMLKRIRKNEVHMISVFDGKENVGSAAVERGLWRQSHVGTIRISVKRDYRGIGLGTLLLKKIIEVAKKDSGIKVLTLGVYAGNTIARNLYHKIGFKTIAKLPKRILYKGKFADEYMMDYPLI